MNTIAYQQAFEKVLHKEQERKQIGTLKEKTVHAVLKHYLEPREVYHEKQVLGFYADILTEHGIVEIQTSHFNLLRKKLSVFLEQYSVTIAYPIPYIKWIKWIDEETGEISEKRKSPKKGSIYHVLDELYKIKPYLLHPNFKLQLLLINVEEYRLLNGWSQDKKKGSSRYDRIPLELVDEHMISKASEYKCFLPVVLDTLKDGFTSKDYQKATGLSLKKAQTALNVLWSVGAVERVGKAGGAYLYERVGEEDEFDII